MIGTLNCIYETPCGWCSKWDKKCDKTIDSKINSDIDNPINRSDCSHEWSPMTCNSGTGRIYICSKCGATKTEPLINYFTII